MKLYKYMHPDRMDVLEGGKLRFTQPACFNDPFEVLPAVREAMPVRGAVALMDQTLAERDQELRRQHQQLMESGPIAELRNALPPEYRTGFGYDAVMAQLRDELPAFLDGFLSQVSTQLRKTFPAQTQERLNRSFGILCLTEKPDNLLMWAHYADCHRGFAVEFDSTHPFFDQRNSPRDLIRRLRKVHYASNRPELTLFDPDADPERFVSALAADFFLTKSEDWEYEREWRMILPVPKCADPQTAIHLFDFPPTAVTGVVLGCRMLEERRNSIARRLQSDPRYHHVRVFNATIDDTRFAVNILPL